MQNVLCVNVMPIQALLNDGTSSLSNYARLYENVHAVSSSKRARVCHSGKRVAVPR